MRGLHPADLDRRHRGVEPGKRVTEGKDGLLQLGLVGRTEPCEGRDGFARSE